MLDRASTFADKEIINLLQTRFVPVAIDQAYQRRQKDTEGDFYRKIAGQGPRKNFQGTTQGLYIATPNGKLLVFNNNRGSDRIKRFMKSALSNYRPMKVGAVTAETRDPRYTPVPPKGGLVLRVRAKVLGGYDESANKWRRMFQTALSRDNLWISAHEHKELARGIIPEKLQRRIARFHLVDNTRGEPPMWRDGEIRKLEMKIEGNRVTGRAHLKTSSGDRGFEASLYGILESKNGKISRFDIVAKGEFWGEGRFTRGAPKGRFPLAVSFELADGSDVADGIPPQGSRGWVPGYIR